MALTIKEQLDILNGVVAPTSYTLNQYVEQALVDACQNFFTNTKVVDPVANGEGFIYKERMLQTCKDVVGNVSRYSPHVTKILIAIYADTGVYATVEAATDDQWVSFIVANVFSALEKVTGVSAQQKADYDSL